MKTEMEKTGHKMRGQESIFRKLVGESQRKNGEEINEETRKGEEIRRERQRRGSRMEKKERSREETT